MTITKVTKLPDGRYSVEQTYDPDVRVKVIDKIILQKTIQKLEKEKADLTDLIAKQRAILTEINKI